MPRPIADELAEFLQQHRERMMQPPGMPAPTVQWQDDEPEQEVEDQGLTPEQ